MAKRKHIDHCKDITVDPHTKLLTMLSSRVIARQLFKSAIVKAPQLAVPACSTISKYHRTLDQSYASRLFIRGYATHVEDYEIDYISLKKKTKEKNENNNEKLDINTPLPNFALKRPENVGFPYHRLHKYDESLMEELLDFYDWDFKITNEEGYPRGLSYTKYYYVELKIFEQFLQDTFNYRIKNFADLSGLEIVNTLFIFKDYYTRGEIPEVTKEKKPKYDEMVKFFIEFVNKDAQFPQEVVKEFFPEVKREREISNFLDLGLYFYVPELKSLDREFNFKRIRSKKDLILQIDKTVKEFNHFLEGNKQADESFFKVLIQVERYKALLDKLAESITPLKVIKNIIERHDFGQAMSETMFEGLEGKEDRQQIEKMVAELGVSWSMLEFGNLIPATGKYSELAPRLYEISTTPNHPFEDKSKHLLEVLTTDELRSGMLLSRLTEYNFETAKYNFTGNLQEDWILNVLLKWDYPLEVALAEKFEDDWYDFNHEDWAACEAYYCIGSSTIKKLAQVPDILVKYLQLKGDSFAKCLPEGSLLLNLKKELAAAKLALGVDFAFFADTQHLIKDIKERVTLPRNTLNGLVSAIDESSRYFGNHLEVLDELAKGSEPEGLVDRHTSANYKQIPDWLRFERHVAEIEFLKSLTGDFGNKSKVISTIEDVTNRILEDGTLYPEINHGSLLILRAKLKEFSVNNTTDCFEILNTVLLSNDVFAQFEKRVKENQTDKPAPYVQIPDELELSDFVGELTKLKDALGGTSFKEHTSDKVLKALDYQIENFFDGDSGKDSLISSNSDSFRYIRLKRRLGRLFDINGQNTESLDILLNSQAVFDSFEKEKLDKEVVAEETPKYRQVPNDFILEEYVLELKQLKDSLHIAKFADVYADEVLAKIEEFSKASYSTTDKKLIWHKLYRNLALLFKHNHGSTFILDNVLTSAAELEKLNKSVTKPKDPVGDQIEFLKREEYDVLGAFLTASRLLYKSDVTKVSKEEFSSLVDMYIATLDATSLGYLFKKAVLGSMKEYNATIEHYPAFIVCLYGMSKNLAGEPITKQRLQEFYADLARSITEETNANSKERLDPMEAVSSMKFPDDKSRDFSNESTAEVEYEYDIREHDPLQDRSSTSEGVSSHGVKYQNSEQYIADLDNQRGGVAKDDSFEDAIRAAFVSALQNDETLKAGTQLSKAKKPQRRLNERISATAANINAIDPVKLEEYLTMVNKDELSKQRQAEAYKWSKAKYDQSLATSSKKYLLLSLVGDEVPVSANLIRDDLSHELDIFEILNKFSDAELALIYDRLQILQNESYKVVGYKLDAKRKYLILENEGGEKQSRGASGKSSRGKRVATTAAAAMLAYLALSFASNEPSKGASDVGARERPGGTVEGLSSPVTGESNELGETQVNKVPVVARYPDLTGQEEHVKDTKRLGFKNILWNTK